MTFDTVRPRAHIERGLAHMIKERRSPQAGVSSTTTSASTTPTLESAKTSPTAVPQAVNTRLPTSVKALAGVITVIGLFLLGEWLVKLIPVAILNQILAVAIWKIRSWRRRRQNAASNLIYNSSEKHNGFGSHRTTRIDLESATVNMEKPSKAFLMPAVPPSSAGVGWVPQLRSDIALPEPAKPRSHRAKKAWEKNLAKFMAPSINTEMPPARDGSPPPSYLVANAAPIHQNAPPMPPMPTSPPRQALPPTPPAALKLSFDGIAPPPSSRTPVSATRNSSFGPHPAVAPPIRSSDSLRRNDKKFPRLMSVSNSFDPSMEDELSITVGETVRILEEYEDEWCLVQRVGRMDAEKGVVPRFCLAERLEVVPTHPGLPSAGSYRR